MAQYMMENGWMICNMVMELKYGMMDQDLRVFINLEKNMDKVNLKFYNNLKANTNGLMDLCT